MIKTAVEAAAGLIVFQPRNGNMVMVRAIEVKELRAAPAYTQTAIFRDISVLQGHEEIAMDRRNHREVVMDDGKTYLTEASLEELASLLPEALLPEGR